MPDLIWHLEDLRVGQCYPNFYVARLASKFVKVVLAGTGGDELFGGYPWRYYRAVNNNRHDDYVQKYYAFWQRLVPNAVIHQLFQPEIWTAIKDVQTIDIMRGVIAGSTQPLDRPEDYVNQSLYFESKTFLHGLLVVEDKLSMAHGLETRVPFLDNDLVDFAMRLPVRAKLRDLDLAIRLDENSPGPKNELYFDRTNDGKMILRQHAVALPPVALRRRREAGIQCARRELVPRRQHRLRATADPFARRARSTNSSGRIPSPRSSASTCAARPTGGC